MYKSIFFFFLLLVSCKEQVTEPAQIGTIKGRVTSPMDTTIGFPNVKLYLVDSDIKIDTIKFSNKKAILDSAITNTNGEFVFKIFNEGRYLVCPIKKDNFIFDFANPNLSTIIDIKKDETKTINFISNLNVSSGSEYFQLDILLKNFKWEASYDLELMKKEVFLTIYRRYWYFFIPNMEFIEKRSASEVIKEPDGSFTIRYNYYIANAYTHIIASADNYFSCDQFISLFGKPPVILFQFYLPFTLVFSPGNEKVNVAYDMLTKKTEIKY